MPARVANIAPCITQVTFKLVHYALLINQLRFGLTFFKVLANFPTDKNGLDCPIRLPYSYRAPLNWQFNGALYEQTDGVAMGSPLGLC